LRNTDKILEKLKKSSVIVELDQSRVLKSTRDEFIIYQSVFIHKDEIEDYVDDFRSAKNPSNQHLMAVDIYLKKVGTSDTLTPTYYMWEKDMQKFVKLFISYIEKTGLDWNVGKATLQVQKEYLQAIRQFNDLMVKKSDLITANPLQVTRSRDYWLWSGRTFKV